MIDSIHSSCPFCGVTLDPQPTTEGLNAGICRHCTENIHLRTPRSIYVLGDQHHFSVYAYEPQTKEWQRTSNPTFLYPTFPNDESAAVGQSGIHSLDTLSEIEAEITQTFAQQSPLESLSHLSAVQVNDDWTETVKTLDPRYRDPLDLEISKILSLLPKPTIFDSGTLHTADTEQLIESLSSGPSPDNTRQQSISELC